MSDGLDIEAEVPWLVRLGASRQTPTGTCLRRLTLVERAHDRLRDVIREHLVIDAAMRELDQRYDDYVGGW